MAPRVATVIVLLVSSPACFGGDFADDSLEQAAPAGLHDGEAGALIQTVLLSASHADGDGGGCTATLLGPRTILTAAHCVTVPSGSPLTWGEVRIPANHGTGQTDAIGIAPDRVRRHPSYPLRGEAGGEVWDVAVVGLRVAASLPIASTPWVRIATSRAADGGAFWINGRIGPGGDAQWDLFHQVAVMGPLARNDPR